MMIAAIPVVNMPATLATLNTSLSVRFISAAFRSVPA